MCCRWRNYQRLNPLINGSQISITYMVDFTVRAYGSLNPLINGSQISMHGEKKMKTFHVNGVSIPSSTGLRFQFDGIDKYVNQFHQESQSPHQRVSDFNDCRRKRETPKSIRSLNPLINGSQISMMLAVTQHTVNVKKSQSPHQRVSDFNSVFSPPQSYLVFFVSIPSSTGLRFQ